MQSFQVVCITNAKTNDEQIVRFDPRISNFNIELLSMNEYEPYELPQSIVKSSHPLNFMKQFLEKHNYDPQSIQIHKPIAFNDLSTTMDDVTFSLVSKFSLPSNFEQAIEILELCHFLQFEQLTESVGLAFSSYFWETQPKSILEKDKNQNKTKQEMVADYTTLMIEYERTIIMGEAAQKNDIFNQHLKKFCPTQDDQ